MSGPPVAPPPIVKDYVDHHVDEVRREIEPRLDAIDQKLAGDLVRFNALGKRIDDQGKAINLRIRDVRGDVRDLGVKLDRHHAELMSLARPTPPPEPLIEPSMAKAPSAFSNLPPWIRWTIGLGLLIGTVLGGIVIAFLNGGGL